MNLEGKRVLVVGSGKSGVAAAELLRKKGITFVLFDGNKDLDVAVLIEKNPVFAGAEILLGELAPEDMARIDLVVLSPGVPTAPPPAPAPRPRPPPPAVILLCDGLACRRSCRWSRIFETDRFQSGARSNLPIILQKEELLQLPEQTEKLRQLRLWVRSWRIISMM